MPRAKARAASKSCVRCVYRQRKPLEKNWMCIDMDRYKDEDATDCCIPFRELRKLQHTARDVDTFAELTHAYINKAKETSIYWSSKGVRR